MERKTILIDTTILIDHLRKKKKNKTLFYRLSSNYDYMISSITEFEFSVGSTSINQEYVDNILTKLPVLPIDSVCVKTAIKIYRTLKPKNKLISLPDIFIAATAITHDLSLLTLNQKHFNRVKNLNLLTETV